MLAFLRAAAGRSSAYLRRLLDKKPSSGETLVELDGLRGFAVLIVIASHADFLGMSGQGGMGVWLFYVLSGFLLTKIILHKLPGSLRPVGLAKYVVRRIARILPLYYLVIGFVAWTRGWSATTLFQHLTFQRAVGHFWSIPQEEVFYVMLPALVGLALLPGALVRATPRWVAALVLLVAVELSYPLFHLHGNGTLLRHNIDVFILGFFLAFLWYLDGVRAFLSSHRLNTALNALTVPLLAIILLGSSGNLALLREYVDVPVRSLTWEFTTTSGVLCAIVLVVTLKSGTWLHRLFSWWPLRVVGVLSFSLYLVHPMVMDQLAWRFGLGTGAPMLVGALAASTALALVLERVIERPFMATGRRLNARY